MSGAPFDWLAHRADVLPQAVALVDDLGVHTYNELDTRVRKVAAAMAAAGVRPGDRVALLAWNSLDFVAVVHATARLGATLVPLNARLGAGELAFQLSDAEPAIFVCDVSLLETARAAALEAGIKPPIAFPVPLPDQSPLLALPHPTPADLCVMYTSGTTGTPKGVRITRENVFASAAGSAFNLGVLPSDRWLVCLPLFHVGGLSVIYRSVIYGTAAVLHRGFDASVVARTLRTGEITHISVVATMLQRLLEVDAAPAPPQLRVMLVGGGPVPPPLLERAAELGYPVVQTYGLTEAASQVTTLSPDDAVRHLGSAGKPLLGTSLRIDGAPGDAGEILVAGPVVSPGYFRRPDATAVVIRDGWLHTGDIGRIDADGYLYVLDRRDDLIVTGGENVYPAEVEAHLLAHGAVREAAVVGLSDDAWGQRVAAAVVVLPGTRPDELQAWLRGRIAGYKIPSNVVLVDVLPRTASGKVQRRLVRAMLASDSEATAP